MEEGAALFVREVAERLHQVAGWSNSFAEDHSVVFTQRIEDRVASRPATDRHEASVRAYAAYLAALLREEVERRARQRTEPDR